MHFKEFCQKASAWDIDIDKSCEFVFNILYCKHFYHVIVYKSAFESFLSTIDQETVSFNFSNLWGEEHVHFFVYSKKNLKNSKGIISVPIRHPEQQNYIERNFIFCSKNQHSLACNFSFSDSLIDIFDDSLANACMRKILENPKDVVGLPKKISEKMLKLNQFKRQNCENCAFFCAFDYEHYKDLILDILILTRPPFIASFDFITHDNKIVKLCYDCMVSEVLFKRNYMHMYSDGLRKILNFYQDSFCHKCKEMPIFSALEYSNFDPRYRWFFQSNTIFPYYFINIVCYFKKLSISSTVSELSCDFFIRALYHRYRNQAIKNYHHKK